MSLESQKPLQSLLHLSSSAVYLYIVIIKHVFYSPVSPQIRDCVSTWIENIVIVPHWNFVSFGKVPSLAQQGTIHDCTHVAFMIGPNLSSLTLQFAMQITIDYNVLLRSTSYVLQKILQHTYCMGGLPGCGRFG